MSLNSMTGFARAEGHLDTRSWIWEVKSVNSKGLNVRCQVPVGFENLEPAVRQRAQKRFHRGSVTVGLSVNWGQTNGSYRINETVLNQVLTALPDLQERAGSAGPPTLDGLLGLRGVMEPVEEQLSEDERQALEAGLLSNLDGVLDELAAIRSNEGGRLAGILGQHLDSIWALCEHAEKLANLQPAAIREQLRLQVAELLEQAPALPEERLVQEAALLMTKADVREELDRLKAHHEVAQNLLQVDGGIGRKLDFLSQEFNREANTLCAKSHYIELTNIGIDLKTTIDQLREQVQNIE